MAINIFKKETDKQVKPARRNDKKPAAPKAVVKPERKLSVLAARTLQYPHVTEKAANLAKNSQYVFKVAKSANKIEIARAIEDYYRVNVVDVRTVNIPAKRKRRGRGIAVIPGYRKAFVKIKKGQTIEAMPQ